eukprot:IDg15733t1
MTAGDATAPRCVAARSVSADIAWRANGGRRRGSGWRQLRVRSASLTQRSPLQGINTRPQRRVCARKTRALGSHLILSMFEFAPFRRERPEYSVRKSNRSTDASTCQLPAPPSTERSCIIRRVSYCVRANNASAEPHHVRGTEWQHRAHAAVLASALNSSGGTESHCGRWEPERCAFCGAAQEWRQACSSVRHISARVPIVSRKNQSLSVTSCRSPPPRRAPPRATRGGAAHRRERSAFKIMSVHQSFVSRSLLYRNEKVPYFSTLIAHCLIITGARRFLTHASVQYDNATQRASVSMKSLDNWKTPLKPSRPIFPADSYTDPA